MGEVVAMPSSDPVKNVERCAVLVVHSVQPRKRNNTLGNSLATPCMAAALRHVAMGFCLVPGVHSGFEIVSPTFKHEEETHIARRREVGILWIIVLEVVFHRSLS